MWYCGYSGVTNGRCSFGGVYVHTLNTCSNDGLAGRRVSFRPVLCIAHHMSPVMAMATCFGDGGCNRGTSELRSAGQGQGWRNWEADPDEVELELASGRGAALSEPILAV